MRNLLPQRKIMIYGGEMQGNLFDKKVPLHPSKKLWDKDFNTVHLQNNGFICKL